MKKNKKSKKKLAHFDGFKKYSNDKKIETYLQRHCKEFNISPLDAVIHFPLYIRRQLLKRFIAHLELFRLSLNVPGDIAEIGVFRGLGLMTWANLLESLSIGSRTKVVYGFDNWSGFSGLHEKDGAPNSETQKTKGGFNAKKYLKQLNEVINIFNLDRFVPWKPRIKLVKGNIETTVPLFLQNNPGIRFSLVHFDCDLYQPTLSALEAIWPRVVRGGVVIFDEYSIKDWPGESAAVDEFFKDHKNLKLKCFEWTNAPACYLVKD